MSRYGGLVRSKEGVLQALSLARENFRTADAGAVRSSSVKDAFRLRDMLLCQVAWLSAMEEYIRRRGVSRGSFLILDDEGMKTQGFTYRGGTDILSSEVCETSVDSESLECFHRWRPVRPIPDPDLWFESVWSRFNTGKT